MGLAKVAMVLVGCKPLRLRSLHIGSYDRFPASVPVGFLPVYVGEQRERFVIPTSFLSHPLFRILLEKAREEYGFGQGSGLLFPCTVHIFREVVRVVQRRRGQFDLGKMVEELNHAKTSMSLQVS